MTEIDRNRFSVLIREHHQSLLAYAIAMAKSESTARDLVQDSCVVAWKSLERFDPTRDFGSWMRGIIRNKWREHCRKRRREAVLDDEILERMERIFANEPDSELFHRLAECKAKLPEAMREVIFLTYDEGRQSDDAASLLSINPATLRKRLERARTALRECLSQEEIS